MFILSQTFKTISADISQSFDNILQAIADLSGTITDSAGIKPEPNADAVISMRSDNNMAPDEGAFELNVIWI